MTKLLLVLLLIITISLTSGCKEEENVEETPVNNHTTLDLDTMLQWQDNEYTTKHTWEEADTFCTNLDMVWQTDWRLPTNEELHIIQDNYDYLFEQFVDDYYWSSTEYAGRNYEHLVAKYWDAAIEYKPNSEYFYVRCVR